MGVGEQDVENNGWIFGGGSEGGRGELEGGRKMVPNIEVIILYYSSGITNK